MVTSEPSWIEVTADIDSMSAMELMKFAEGFGLYLDPNKSKEEMLGHLYKWASPS